MDWLRVTVMSKNDRLILEIFDSLKRVGYVLNSYAHRSENPAGITGQQLWVLRILASGNHIRVSDLARFMSLHPATIVGVLDRLEGKQLVKRKRSHSDRRAVELTLTAAGKKLVATTPDVLHLMLERGLMAQPEKKLSEIAETIGQLEHILHDATPENGQYARRG